MGMGSDMSDGSGFSTGFRDRVDYLFQIQDQYFKVRKALNEFHQQGRRFAFPEDSLRVLIIMVSRPEILRKYKPAKELLDDLKLSINCDIDDGVEREDDIPDEDADEQPKKGKRAKRKTFTKAMFKQVIKAIDTNYPTSDDDNRSIDGLFLKFEVITDILDKAELLGLVQTFQSTA